MKRFIVKEKISIKKKILVIIMVIVGLSSLFINTIGKRSTRNSIYISKNIINAVLTNVVNNNIRTDIFKKYNIDDLIIVNYQDNSIVGVDYNLEKAYEVLLEIKRNIINSMSKEIGNYYNYDYKVNNNNVILEMPFYNYTDNVLISNIGPKIIVSLSMVRVLDGSVKTKVKTYGINSLLIELYLNFNVTSMIVIPYNKDGNVINNYEVLLSSKVIEGKVPSMYNGLLESNSSIISE